METAKLSTRTSWLVNDQLPPIYSSLASTTISEEIPSRSMGKYLRTHFVTTEALHLRCSLRQWTNDSSLEWRYTQSPINVLFDTTLRLQVIPVRSSRRFTNFSVWRPASRITTFSTPTTVSSQYPITAASRGTTVQVTRSNPTPISFAAH